MSNKRSCPYKTLNGLEQLSGTSLVIDNITIQGPTSYPTYTLTLPPNDGSPGQILSTDGTGVLSWVNDSGSTGTVTSVSASVPAWLSVTVTNPTTTPAIAITGTSTGTGTVTVLQDAPTLFNTVTMTGEIHMNRTSGNGSAIRIHNAQSAPQENYIEIGHNSNNHNHAYFGHNYLIDNDPGNYAYIQTNGRKLRFSGAANFTLPITEGTSGQSLITDGLGVTSWADRVSTVSVTVPSFMSVTVTNAATTPAIAISATSTGTGNVVLDNSPTMSIPLINQFATISAGSGSNDAATLIVRALTDVYITKYKAGAANQLNNAFMITTNPSNSANTFFYTQGTSVGIFSHAPQETLDVQGSIRASSFIRFNNVSVYPGSSGVLSLYLPITTGTSGQVLTSTGSGTAMTWTTPTTGTLTAVTATSPIVSSGGTTPDISLSTVPTTLGGTGLTTVGTNGQVLTSNGTSLTWTTPTTWTVTSVAATSPLASSGGATPTISIASSTGTGSVVLNTDPELQTSFNLKAPVLGEGYLRFVSVSNTNYIQTALSNVSGSIADLVIGSHTNTSQLMIVKASGNVGIGTTTPAQKLTVESGRIRIDDTNNAVLELKTNAFISYAYTDAGGSFVVTPGNQIRFEGITSISKPGGQQLYIDSSDGYAFMAFAPNNVRKCYFGFAYGGGAAKNLVFVNEYSDGGDIEIDCAWASARIRCIKPILLQETVTLRKHPSSGIFSFVFPSSMGTSGQVLTTDGTNTYWGSGGGGGGGTVNSVTASAPLASSGGTAPDISIASASGTGAVVLATTPTIDTLTLITDQGGILQFMDPNHAIYGRKQFGAPPGHVNDYLSYYAYAGHSWFGGNQLIASQIEMMRLTPAGNLGIGTTAPGCKVDVLTTLGNTAMRLKGTPESLILDGTDHVFMRYAWAGVNKAYVGFGNAGDPNFDISNAATGGHINLFPNANVGIGTTSPAAKLHVNGSLRVQGAAITQNGAQSEFSSGSYFDPDSGQVYNAKFGNTDPLSNGIAVKGNSRFTSSVRAANFTTNGTDLFTYYESTDPSLCTMQGSNLNGGTYGIDCIDSAFIFVTDKQVSVTRIGKIVTVSFVIDFSYNANPTPGFTKMAIVLKYPSIRTPANVTNMYAQGICNWPTNISGVGNPLSVTAYNCTAQGVAAVALLVTGSAGLVDYNTLFAQSNQRLTGSITYVIR